MAIIKKCRVQLYAHVYNHILKQKLVKMILIDCWSQLTKVFQDPRRETRAFHWMTFLRLSLTASQRSKVVKEATGTRNSRIFGLIGASITIGVASNSSQPPMELVLKTADLPSFIRTQAAAMFAHPQPIKAFCYSARRMANAEHRDCS